MAQLTSAASPANEDADVQDGAGRRRRFGWLRGRRGHGDPQPAAAPRVDALLPAALANLALRDLTLVESLLRVVEDLEEREEDPDVLESLFRIDHLATRMRRHGENLLVLAGQSSDHDRHEPVPLIDVVRAAVSEISEYDRADVATLPQAQVSGLAADDVSHLLAELLDNATSRSPHHTRVDVSARVVGDGEVVVAVEDNGIGIPVGRLAELNARLSAPPVLDVSVTRHMGLYVVGQLAHRHGLRVQLQARPFGGTAAYVVLPRHLIHAQAFPDASDDLRDHPGTPTRTGARPGGRADQPVTDPRTAPVTSPVVQPLDTPGSGTSGTTTTGLPRRTPGATTPRPAESSSAGPRVDRPALPAAGSAAARLLQDLGGFEDGQLAARRSAWQDDLTHEGQ